jgi:hypothetical protein
VPDGPKEMTEDGYQECLNLHCFDAHAADNPHGHFEWPHARAPLKRNLSAVVKLAIDMGLSTMAVGQLRRTRVNDPEAVVDQGLELC